jgi:DNA replication and repair protein RecF
MAYIRRLVLDAFRNYQSASLSCEEAPVVLVGENGAGKTNVLEAVSLLSPGRGLRRAGLGDLHNTHIPAAHPWSLFFDLHGKAGETAIGIGRDPEAEAGTERRTLRIDGKTHRGQTALTEHVNVLWLTPEMDRLLAESASERRRFMDRMTYALDPAHLARLTRYEDAMRQRLRLLRDGITDAAWLSALEDTMAREGIAVAAGRRIWLEQITHHLMDEPRPFPRLSLMVEGHAENMLGTEAASDAEEQMRASLRDYRPQDMAAGITHLGPHRSDLKVHHLDKDMPAFLCSTGEQKALLISLTLSQTRLLRQLHHASPLVLLDDITAHLDESRRMALCQHLLELETQAWLTGTDKDFFMGFDKKAQLVCVKEGGFHPLQ